ncbi:MAG: electron transfer flavoprotein subunit beta/FixA family protein, partial [Rhodomicrobium sp.]|nr:electron transfer flavoprotein subunit beta/FixA family protein [Rhodomicrobium sp.]
IMKAKKKPLDEVDAAALGFSIEPKIRVIKTSEPPVRKAGIKVQSATELVEKLRTEAGVLQ